MVCVQFLAAARSRPALVDAAVAAVLSVVQLWATEPSLGAETLACLLITVPLAWRRRWPLAVFAVLFLVALAAGPSMSPQVTFVSVLLSAYSLIVHERQVWLSIGAILAACTLVAAVREGEVRVPVPGWAGAFAILLPVIFAGLAIRAARGHADASAERADALRASQEAATRVALAEERARIARELHDVVSHHVSVMVIQADAAERVIVAQPDQARRSVQAIAQSGREAMGELRHLLGVLAPQDDGVESADELRPQPGLDQLGALIARTRAAGQPVTLAGAVPAALPHSVGLAAYRVVQEALTNALRYAPGAPTTVRVDADHDALCVEVTDEGAPGAPQGLRGNESGLIGLRERLALYGATVQAGRRLGGGFRVAARIPLEPAA